MMMHEKLINFIKSQITIDDESLSIILSNFKERKIAKNRFVLKKGHTAATYFFVKSGGLRIHFDFGDKQVTGWIALENEFFTDLASLKLQVPSKFNIQAIEDSELLIINADKMHELYNKYPEWQRFGRQIWENAFLKVIEGIINYQTLTAEERYLSAMQQGDLLQKIPLKHLSTYLGITPTSLSRLRKNVK